MGAAIKGENPLAISKRFDGEYVFYTSKGYDSGDGSVGIIGGANFDAEGTGNHVFINQVRNGWRRSELFENMLFNSFTGEFRDVVYPKATGTIEPVYIEFEVAFTAYSGGQYLIARQLAKSAAKGRYSTIYRAVSQAEVMTLQNLILE